MFNKQTICITLAAVLCCSIVKPTIAQPVPVLALPLVSNPVGLVFVSTVVVGGVIWYIYLDRHHRKFRSHVAPSGTVDSESNEQHEEKLVKTTTKGKSCEEIAQDLSKETGKKWRVKKMRIIPYTGPLWEPPGNPVQIECLLTTLPKE